MATYYADSAGSQGTGDGSSAANAATLIECIENDGVLHTSLVSGSTIYCKTGTEIIFDGSAGAYATTGVVGAWSNPIKVFSYTTTPGDSIGVTEIRDTDNGSTNDALKIDHDYWWISGFKFTDCRSSVSITTGADGILLHNIESKDAISHGFEENGSTGTSTHYIRCFSHGSGSDGFYTGARSNRFVGCVAINNAGVGINLRNTAYGSTCVNCLVYDNDSHGILGQTETLLVNCTIVNNNSNGFVASNAVSHFLVNTIIGDNGSYALAGNYANTSIFTDNCVVEGENYANASGVANGNILHTQINSNTGDPLFVDDNPVDPLDVDLSPGNGSSLLGAGSKLGGDGFAGTNTFIDIGAGQRRPGGAPIALI